METRWSGRAVAKGRSGIRAPVPPRPGWRSFEIVNDAFVEYLPVRALSIRAASSSSRSGSTSSSRARARVARARHLRRLLLSWTARPGRHAHTPGRPRRRAVLGAFNGNRFFADATAAELQRSLRKLFDRLPLAAGVSAQFGRQLVPDGVTGNDHEHLIGADVQWAWRRLGVRAEFVTGNRPSTLLDSRARVRARISSPVRGRAAGRCSRCSG